MPTIRLVSRLAATTSEGCRHVPYGLVLSMCTSLRSLHVGAVINLSGVPLPQKAEPQSGEGRGCVHVLWCHERTCPCEPFRLNLDNRRAEKAEILSLRRGHASLRHYLFLLPYCLRSSVQALYAVDCIPYVFWNILIWDRPTYPAWTTNFILLGIWFC